MQGFECYLHQVIDVVSLDLQPHLKSPDPKISENLGADLFGLPRPHPPPPGTQAPRQAFLYKIFKGASEIHESIEALENIGIYIRRFPYADTSVTRSAHLRYHLENYLHEVYILQKRLEAYLTVLDRSYRRDPDSSAIHGKINACRRAVRIAFQRLSAARGGHVHRERYEDDDLSPLRIQELLTPRMPQFKDLFNFNFKKIRRKKIRWVESNNESIRKILDICFDALGPIVFLADGRLRYPRRLAGSD